jgi:hypothetical protein
MSLEREAETVEADMRDNARFPGVYEELGQEIGELVDKKNAAYGDSFNRSGVILKELYPKGIAPEQYNDVLAMIRIIDKLFRIATNKDAFGENPWQDIAGYAILKSLMAPGSEALNRV